MVPAAQPMAQGTAVGQTFGSFCPSCGNAVAGGNFCTACGHNLQTKPQLPTV